MKKYLPAIFFLLVGAAYAQQPQPKPAVVATPSGYSLQWDGVVGRTYFIESSADMTIWSFLPEVKWGSGSYDYSVNYSSGNLYFRLKYTDAPSANPENEDFDGDGLPSLFEVSNNLNPLVADTDGNGSSDYLVDTDGDGLADGWEFKYFGGVDIASSGADLDSDGLTNLQESQLDTNPNQLDTDSNGLSDYFEWELVGRWEFDGDTAPSATDTSGNHHHGTLVNGAAFANAVGVKGGSLELTATTNGYLSLPRDVLHGEGTITASMWYKASNPGHAIHPFISGANNGNNNEALFFLDDAADHLTAYNGENANWSISAKPYYGIDPATVLDGNWHHYVWVRDQQNQKMIYYIDGVEVFQSTTTLNNLEIDPNGLLIGQEQDSVAGGFDTGQRLRGHVDNVTIYRRALSGQEVSALWNVDTDNDGYSDRIESHESTNPEDALDFPFEMDRTRLAAGFHHNLVVDKYGTLWAWGRNQYGQLGTGSNINFRCPGKLGWQGTFKAVAAGEEHSVAVLEDGRVVAFGRNNEGQLGNGRASGTENYSYDPVHVLDNNGDQLTNVIAVAAYGNHSFALKADGTVWAWGYDGNSGVLGIGQFSGSPYYKTQAHQVSVLTSGVKQVVTGEVHTLALKDDGTIWAWGNGSYVGLGSGTSTQYAPVQVTSLSNIDAIAAGGSHSLALKNDGTVWAWGSGDSGRLGNATTNFQHTPVQVSTSTGLTNVKQIAAGRSHSLAIDAQGQAWGWGWNGYGQLGDGGVSSTVNEPMQIPGMANTVSLGGAEYRSVFALADGALKSCGRGQYEQLGTGADPSGNQQLPALVKRIDTDGFTARPQVSTWPGMHGLEKNLNVTLSCATEGASIYYTTDGSIPDQNSTLYQPGNPVSLSGDIVLRARAYRAPLEPSPVFAAHYSLGLGAIASGDNHNLSLDSVGNVRVWGDHGYGQLGLGTNAPNDKALPEILAGYGPFKAIASGRWHSLAVTQEGKLLAFGRNHKGQLGNGDTANQNVPVYVVDGSNNHLTDVVAVSAFEDHSLALKADGSVWAWGDTDDGQLGVGDVSGVSYYNQAQPVVGLASGVIAITAGDSCGIALKLDGSVWGWGASYLLASGSGSDQNVPTLLSGVYDLAGVDGGDDHFLGIDSLGNAFAWGSNSYGVFGDDTTNSNSSWPVQVSSSSSMGQVFSVSAGDDHSLAASMDGRLWVWGRRDQGALGDGLNDGEVHLPKLIRLQGGDIVHFEKTYIFPYGVDQGQDGQGSQTTTATVHSSGSEIQLQGNIWKRVDFPYNVTANTILEFEFKCDVQGEIHGIGLDEDVNNVGGGRAFQIYGTQGGTDLVQNSEIYSGSNWQSFRIRVGDHYIGQKSHLVFVGDDDANGASNARFRNIRVFEDQNASQKTVRVQASKSHSLVLARESWDGETLFTFGNGSSGQIGDGRKQDRLTPYMLAFEVDSDGDGLDDRLEAELGTNRLVADTDGDGISDYLAWSMRVSGTSLDSDGDGISNASELANGTNPLEADSDHDGVNDAQDTYPLDPDRSVAGSNDPNDTTAPVITLVDPSNAVPVGNP